MAGDNRLVYGIAAGAAAVLMVWGLVGFHRAKENNEAEAKAASLAAAFASAGLPEPPQKIVVSTLGTDGGQVCADPAAALDRATTNLGLTNGAAQVGVRPIIASDRLAKAEELVLSVYCPERLPAFQDHLKDLKLQEA
jgi:hypothetical protein